jgi:hypothetical protein
MARAGYRDMPWNELSHSTEALSTLRKHLRSYSYGAIRGVSPLAQPPASPSPASSASPSPRSGHSASPSSPTPLPPRH